MVSASTGFCAEDVSVVAFVVFTVGVRTAAVDVTLARAGAVRPETDAA